MALPIGETPILKGREATTFIKRMHKDAQKPVGPIPTPKLDEAYKSIKEYAEQKQK
jgi:hypothetical protein